VLDDELDKHLSVAFVENCLVDSLSASDREHLPVVNALISYKFKFRFIQNETSAYQFHKLTFVLYLETESSFP